MADSVKFEWGLQGSEPFETTKQQDLPDFVLKVHWTLMAYLGEDSVSTFGVHTFEAKTQEEADKTGDTFIPFEELTPQIVFSWLGRTDWANETKSKLVEKLNEVMLQKDVEKKQAPWVKQEVSEGAIGNIAI